MSLVILGRGFAMDAWRTDGTAALALYGPPGSGKSTVSGILRELCGDHGVAFSLLKLAEPLYELQSLIYRSAGRPLPDRYAQDGELLSTLGRQLRRIQPSILIDDLNSRLGALGAPEPTIRGRLVLCDDMRPVDASGVRDLGFALVRVFCPTDTARERHLARLDLANEQGTRPLESGADDLTPDYLIDNSGDAAALHVNVRDFFRELWP